MNVSLVTGFFRKMSKVFDSSYFPSKVCRQWWVGVSHTSRTLKWKTPMDIIAIKSLKPKQACRGSYQLSAQWNRHSSVLTFQTVWSSISSSGQGFVKHFMRLRNLESYLLFIRTVFHETPGLNQQILRSSYFHWRRDNYISFSTGHDQHFSSVCHARTEIYLSSTPMLMKGIPL